MKMFSFLLKSEEKHGSYSYTSTVVKYGSSYYFMEKGTYEGKSAYMTREGHNVILPMVVTSKP